jgi:hypothetical protein
MYSYIRNQVEDYLPEVLTGEARKLATPIATALGGAAAASVFNSFSPLDIDPYTTGIGLGAALATPEKSIYQTGGRVALGLEGAKYLYNLVTNGQDVGNAPVIPASLALGSLGYRYLDRNKVANSVAQNSSTQDYSNQDLGRTALPFSPEDVMNGATSNPTPPPNQPKPRGRPRKKTQGGNVVAQNPSTEQVNRTADTVTPEDIINAATSTQQPVQAPTPPVTTPKRNKPPGARRSKVAQNTSAGELANETPRDTSIAPIVQDIISTPASIPESGAMSNVSNINSIKASPSSSIVKASPEDTLRRNLSLATALNPKKVAMILNPEIKEYDSKRFVEMMSQEGLSPEYLNKLVFPSELIKQYDGIDYVYNPHSLPVHMDHFNINGWSQYGNTIAIQPSRLSKGTDSRGSSQLVKMGLVPDGTIHPNVMKLSRDVVEKALYDPRFKDNPLPAPFGYWDKATNMNYPSELDIDQDKLQKLYQSMNNGINGANGMNIPISTANPANSIMPVKYTQPSENLDRLSITEMSRDIPTRLANDINVADFFGGRRSPRDSKDAQGNAYRKAIFDFKEDR